MKDMNNKAVLGIIVAFIVIFAGYFGVTSDELKTAIDEVNDAAEPIEIVGVKAGTDGNVIFTYADGSMKSVGIPLDISALPVTVDDTPYKLQTLIDAVNLEYEITAKKLTDANPDLNIGTYFDIGQFLNNLSLRLMAVTA